MLEEISVATNCWKYKAYIISQRKLSKNEEQQQ